MLLSSHAPRERVSWNEKRVAEHNNFARRHAPRERVSWNISITYYIFAIISHAPRERVSWNNIKLHFKSKQSVTLHVSVWVEMPWSVSTTTFNTSRSTWACELKFDNEVIENSTISHAPRERVSWNVNSCTFFSFPVGHAPRERVSWNAHQWCLVGSPMVTLHVSVWVEIRICITYHAGITVVTLHVSVWVEIIFWIICMFLNVSRSTWACELKCKIISTSVDFNGVTLHVSVWVEISYYTL